MSPSNTLPDSWGLAGSCVGSRTVRCFLVNLAYGAVDRGLDRHLDSEITTNTRYYVDSRGTETRFG